jgi:hypothetical protein
MWSVTNGGLNDSTRAERRKATRVALEEHFGEEAGDEIADHCLIQHNHPCGELSGLDCRSHSKSEGLSKFLSYTFGTTTGNTVPGICATKKVNRDDFRFVFHGEQLSGHATAEVHGITK